MSQTATTSKPADRPPALLSVMPAVFVILWATGFIGAKYGLPYAEPFTLLAYRFWIVAALFLAIVIATGAPWPKSAGEAGHNMVVGVLLHGVYLGGVFAAIAYGMSAGLSALIVGLQPALTALVARPLLGETISAVQWGGIAMGFFGLFLVVGTSLGDTFDVERVGGYPALILCAAGLIAITAGSMYQKAYCGNQDLRTGALFQYIGGASTVTLCAFLYESGRIEWTVELILAVSWMVFMLSVGAVSLLMIIIRHGDISKVASMFYLVPLATAVMAWPLFGETLNLLQIAGIAIAAFGVMLVTRSRPAPRSS